jgi:hypothetical protein
MLKLLCPRESRGFIFSGGGTLEMSNSRNEPSVSLEEASQLPERRRTVWIWIIFVWYLLWGLLGVSSLWLVSYDTMFSEVQPKLGVPFPRFGFDIKIISTVVAVTNIAAAWSLFMLRSSAVKLFALALLMSVVSIAYSLIMIPNYLAFMRASPGGWVGVPAGLGVGAIILLYAMRLRRRGVLL